MKVIILILGILSLILGINTVVLSTVNNRKSSFNMLICACLSGGLAMGFGASFFAMFFALSIGGY